MSLSVDRVAKPGRVFGRRGTIGRSALELQDTAFRASRRTFTLAVVGLKQATAAQSSGSKLPRHGAVLDLRIVLIRISRRRAWPLSVRCDVNKFWFPPLRTGLSSVRLVGSFNLRAGSFVLLYVMRLISEGRFRQ